jgi:hypothetical protein
MTAPRAILCGTLVVGVLDAADKVAGFKIST